jgi:hypothetical protein
MGSATDRLAKAGPVKITARLPGARPTPAKVASGSRNRPWWPFLSLTSGASSLDGACTNWAGEYFSRLRRGEIGHHHHISGPLPPPLSSGSRVARGQPPGRQWRASDARCRAGDGQEAERRFLRLLAAPQGGLRGLGGYRSLVARATHHAAHAEETDQHHCPGGGLRHGG